MESDANSSSSGGGGGEKTPHYNCYYRNTHPLPHALLRHTTSPPLPFFSQFHSHHGNGNGDLTPSSIRLMSHTSFLSGSVAPSLSEVEHENGAKVGNPNSMGGNDSIFTSGFPMGSWSDSSHFAENFAIKREPNNDHKILGASEKLPGGISRPALSHRLSLPKLTPEMLAMEKLLQLQDTVPCKIRAKRGCATHPRSIAERVRRTRISERMRKLQELVPNMDKQTNTADMLDLAVDYIKNLQKQYAALNDSRTKCKCSASHSLSR